MKSQAFADQSKFEFMKSKRMFEINPRHPMIVELNSRVMEKPEGDESLTDMITSLYMSAVVSAGYQLTPEDATDFAGRVAKLVGGNLNIAFKAPAEHTFDGLRLGGELHLLHQKWDSPDLLVVAVPLRAPASLDDSVGSTFLQVGGP